MHFRAVAPVMRIVGAAALFIPAVYSILTKKSYMLFNPISVCSSLIAGFVLVLWLYTAS